MKNLPPSTFCDHPYSSVLQKTEAEIVACNIMKIRKRLGDKWPLDWETYKKERKTHGAGFSEIEKGYFDEVIKLIPDFIGAIAFSKVWADAARKTKSLLI